MSVVAKCKTVKIRPGSSGRKRSFTRKLCWGKASRTKSGGIKSNCNKSGPCRGSARRKSSTTRKRKTTVSRNTAKTFVAKASYAKTQSGKLRKGCRKVNNVYRCKKTGAARRSR